MAQIIERIFTYVPAKAISIGGEQWSRTLALGNQWSRIRMGFLGTIKGGVTTQGYLLLGLSNGQLGGATAIGNNAIGCSLSGSVLTGASTWTYNSNSGYPYYSTSSGKVYRRYPGYPGAFGPSLSIETGSSISTVNIAASPDPSVSPNYALRRSPIYFDISREVGGGGTAAVTVYGPQTSAMTLDLRPDLFLEGLDQPGTPTLFGTAMTLLLNTTIPLGETLGALDSFFIHWARSASPLEVYAVGLSILRSASWSDGFGGGANVGSAYSTTGTATAESINLGTGFAGPSVFSGTYTNPGVVTGYAGTCGFPFDSFDQYSNGTVVSGVTIANGTGWAEPGVL